MLRSLLVAVVVVVVLVSGCDALWPLPSSVVTGSGSICVSSNLGISSSCDLVNKAINRYQDGLFFPVEALNGSSYSIVVTVDDCIDKISYQTNESYQLILETNTGKIIAPTTFGAIRALETLSQLFVYSSEGCYTIDGVSLTINDNPRYAWRGFLQDTSRHFLSTNTLKKQIDALSYAKFNVFHWHMVDAQSFPINIASQPELSKKGAYKYPEATYSTEEILSIVEYANERGIRVIAEIDIPGHAASWGKGHPEIVANCPRYSANINNIALNPSIQATYEVIFAVLSELSALIPDDYVHVGGDEVVYGCWFNDSSISSWANENNFNGDDIMIFFEENLATILSTLKRKRVVWEEVFLAGALDNSIPSIVQVWKDSHTMQQVLNDGYEGLQSYGWYLDKQIPSIAEPPLTHYLYQDTWLDMYSVEPTEGLSGVDLSLLIGGEAAMWGEQIDDDTVFARVWPRAGAVAERLWSPQDVTDTDSALPRLEDFACRLKRRGIGSNPIRAGYCDATTWIQDN